MINLETICENIKRLIEWRRIADRETQERINVQLNKLYDFKYQLLRGE